MENRLLKLWAKFNLLLLWSLPTPTISNPKKWRSSVREKEDPLRLSARASPPSGKIITNPAQFGRSLPTILWPRLRTSCPSPAPRGFPNATLCWQCGPSKEKITYKKAKPRNCFSRTATKFIVCYGTKPTKISHPSSSPLISSWIRIHFGLPPR